MVHKDSPIAHYKTVSLNTIAKHPFVIYTPSKSLVLKPLETRNHMPKIIYADSPVIPIPNLHPIPIKEKIISELGYLQKASAFIQYLSDFYASPHRKN